MPAQNIEPLLNGACGHLVFISMVFICFANDEAVSRWFCSSSIAEAVLSSGFVCWGLPCAFLAALGVSDRQPRSCWLCLCTILRAFHPGSHLNNLTFCSFLSFWYWFWCRKATCYFLTENLFVWQVGTETWPGLAFFSFPACKPSSVPVSSPALTAISPFHQ